MSNSIWDNTQQIIKETEEVLLRILNKPTPCLAFKDHVPNKSLEPTGNASPLSADKALQVLELCKRNDYKLRRCKNASRGCLVNTYYTITNIHETFCSLNIAIKLKVIGQINLNKSNDNKFKPFCKTFAAKYGVYFLIKNNKNNKGFKINVAGYIVPHKFVIKLLSTDNKIIETIKGMTSSNIYYVDPEVVKEHGPHIKYVITIEK